MTNTAPERQHGKIRWPNEPGAERDVWEAAQQEAWSMVAEGEQVYDFQLHGGVAERGNDAVMVWSYSYQVVKPGGQAARR